MNSIPPSDFACRFFEVEPQNPGEWVERPSGSFPPPPRAFKKKQFGFSMPWHSWHVYAPAGKRLQVIDQTCVSERETTTLVWCQDTQSFWAVPCDFTIPDNYEEGRDRDNFHCWSPMYFDCVPRNERPTPQSLYSISVHGDKRQLDFACPETFDEFLPFTKFTGVRQNVPAQCKLVGKLSLILALQAMCPENGEDIKRQIDHYFWRDNKEYYVPTTMHSEWQTRNKNSMFS